MIKCGFGFIEVIIAIIIYIILQSNKKIKFVKVVDYGIGMGHMKVYGSYQSGIILVGRIA